MYSTRVCVPLHECACDKSSIAFSSDLFHDFGSFLVVELQLGDGLIDAHATDLRTQPEPRPAVRCEAFYETRMSLTHLMMLH